MKNIVLTMLLLGFAIAATGSLTACNTARGFGEDMQDAGESISNAF